MYIYRWIYMLHVERRMSSPPMSCCAAWGSAQRVVTGCISNNEGAWCGVQSHQTIASSKVSSDKAAGRDRLELAESVT